MDKDWQDLAIALEHGDLTDTRVTDNTLYAYRLRRLTPAGTIQRSARLFWP